MFDNLLKSIDKFKKGVSISIPIAIDKEGYIDKQCPSEQCLFYFKVYAEDWKNIFKEEAVYCPRCRHEQSAKNWFTEEQCKHFKNEAGNFVSSQIHNALVHDAKSFNNKFRSSGFLTISMKTTGTSRSYILPAPATEELRLKITCEKCTANYSVIGVAYFCPCCGYNTVERNFDGSLERIKRKVTSTALTVKYVLEQNAEYDESIAQYQDIIESGISDCVSAFQSFAENLFNSVLNHPPVPFNAFQRLKQGSELWRQILGEGYENWLSIGELEELNVLFQKRHILEHKNGIIDEDYIKKSFDTTYKVGQRVVIKENDILRMLRLVSILADNIRNKIK